jgi:hypothetical protein
MNGIMIGGVIHPLKTSAGVPVQVRRWNDGQLPVVPEFKAGDGYNKKRFKPIDLFVFHWTGGENDPIPMAETLRKRSLGVEFAISRSGTVYQYCDPLVVDTADAGIVNSRSAGCEMICYGYAGMMGAPKLGKDRELYVADTHGKAVKTAKFYPAQIQAAIALADAFSTAVPAVQRKVPPAALKTAMSQVDLDQFKGYIGHYQITTNKRDPGPDLMDQLRYAFEARGVA